MTEQEEFDVMMADWRSWKAEHEHTIDLTKRLDELEERDRRKDAQMDDLRQDMEQLQQNHRVLQIKIGSLVQENLSNKFDLDQEILALKRRILKLEQHIQSLGGTPVP